MVDATHISFVANDRSYFALIKKQIHRLAQDTGLSESRLNELDLIVAEMTSNLYKYSHDGELLLGLFNNGGAPYAELICIDNGPGMANPGKMLQDGISSTHTLGHGLGSIKRLSDIFELYSLPNWGTIVLSRIYHDPRQAKIKQDSILTTIIVAKPGEETSGDGFVTKRNQKHIKLMLADGLGHGPEANKAINEAAIAFRVFPEYSPTETLRFVHSAIKKTRGAVITIVGYEYAEKTWNAAGIGNIACRFNGPVVFKNHMSYNGIVGHNIPNTMNDQLYPLAEYNQLMLCSDGIKARTDLLKYPQISKYDQTILAAAIYKDHARRNDDMSVVLLKIM